MKIIKNIKDDRFSIELIDEKKDVIQIEYGGEELYWIMLDYYEDNLFIVSEKDEQLFSQLNKIFSIIKQCDRFDNKLLNNNIFEWISEAYGLPEESNKLTIEKKEKCYEIKFYNNPERFFGNKSICCICFCLNGSRNQEIACSFSNMLLDYKDEHILIRKK